MTDIAPGDHEHLRACLPHWQSKKIVAADKIVDIDVAGIPFDGHIVITTENGTRLKQLGSWYVKHEPNVGGYFVLYKDGYASYSPAEPFEEGNVAIPKE
ncbi:hypothetical protein D3C85_814160 [compost metagenome]